MLTMSQHLKDLPLMVCKARYVRLVLAIDDPASCILEGADEERCERFIQQWIQRQEVLHKSVETDKATTDTMAGKTGMDLAGRMKVCCWNGGGDLSMPDATIDALIGKRIETIRRNRPIPMLSAETRRHLSKMAEGQFVVKEALKYWRLLGVKESTTQTTPQKPWVKESPGLASLEKAKTSDFLSGVNISPSRLDLGSSSGVDGGDGAGPPVESSGGGAGSDGWVARGQKAVWRYDPPDGKCLPIRFTPTTDMMLSTIFELRPGAEVEVAEERVQGGKIFLRLADGRGWVFNKNEKGVTICTKVSAPIARLRGAAGNSVRDGQTKKNEVAGGKARDEKSGTNTSLFVTQIKTTAAGSVLRL